MGYNSKHTILLDPSEGYNLTKTEYKKYHRHLDSFYSLDFNRFIPRERINFSIIDLGAGDGRMWHQLKDIKADQYIACDCAKELLSQHPGRVKKVVCDLEKKWIFEDTNFDLAVAFFLLEHIEDLDHFFQEAYRVLKPGGQLFVGHFLQKRLFMWNINAKRFKIVQYQHTIDELERSAKNAFFTTGIIPLYDRKNLTGHFLVCEK